MNDKSRAKARVNVSMPTAPADSNELAVLWDKYYSSSGLPVMPVSGVLGVVADRPHVKKRVLSLDLCEIVRQTHIAFASFMGQDASYVGSVVWDYNGHGLDSPYHKPDIAALINSGKVPPVREIAWIRQVLRKLHKNTLIIANTSSEPGTEEATIKFLNEHLPGCFDGILFPRNADGTGSFTKGQALQCALRTVGVQSARVVHIDDAPHHNASMTLLKNSEDIIKNIQPIMPLFKPGDNAVNKQTVELPEGVMPALYIEEAFASAADCLSTKS